MGHVSEEDRGRRMVFPMGPRESREVIVSLGEDERVGRLQDRKSTRLNSSHSQISYAAFCLNKQTRNIAKVTTAVAKGDLSQKITVYAKGEIFDRQHTITIMDDTLNSFSAPVTC